MNLSELRLILNDLDIKIIRETKPGQLQVSCPLSPFFHKKKTDRHPSMGINYGGEVTIFKCFTCGESGKLWYLIDSLARLKKSGSLANLALQVLKQDRPTLSSKLRGLDLDDWYPQKKVQSIALDDSVLDRFCKFSESPAALNYLCGKRKIEFAVASEFNIRFDREYNRIIFPVFCNQHKLRGAVGRVIDNSQPRYYNYFGFNSGDTLGGLDKIGTNSTVIVVEGFFDLLKSYSWAKQKNYEVVCTWRGEVTPKQIGLLLGLDKNISVWYDMDKVGELGWKKLQEAIGKNSYGLERVKWEGDFDVGDMDKETFEKILKNHKQHLKV